MWIKQPVSQGTKLSWNKESRGWKPIRFTTYANNFNAKLSFQGKGKHQSDALPLRLKLRLKIKIN